MTYFQIHVLIPFLRNVVLQKFNLAAQIILKRVCLNDDALKFEVLSVQGLCLGELCLEIFYFSQRTRDDGLIKFLVFKPAKSAGNSTPTCFLFSHGVSSYFNIPACLNDVSS